MIICILFYFLIFCVCHNENMHTGHHRSSKWLPFPLTTFIYSLDKMHIFNTVQCTVYVKKKRNGGFMPLKASF